jgi:oligopeptidase B
MTTLVTDTGKDYWREIIPHRDEVYLSDFEIFKNFLVISERKDGLNLIRIRPWDGSEEHYLDFGEPAYFAYISTNMEFDTPLVRYGYSSLLTPSSIFDYDMKSKEKMLLKQDEVLGGYKPEDYRSERLHAEARDGTLIPISIVYPKDFKKDGKNPLLLYAYGSYGYSMNPTFGSARLSLLERGFAYAIAHVRGGQELGRRWYEDGKLLKKKNTFNDFIDCARYLITQRYTNPEGLFAMGGSAGGLLVGAVANLAPELFKGIIAEVPWVDVVTTMLDPDVPLTTAEYDEWGDPNQREYYEYMLSYSPYDQVEAKEYPNMLVTAGLHDSQVQYWEPAKWVAKLRALKTDDNTLLFKTYMEAGHGGPSGRFRRHRETALAYAFILDLLGIRK